MATSSSLITGSLSQTFTITLPTGVQHLTVPSVVLYFITASSSFGVTASIVATTNGLPDVSKPVTNASVTLDAGSISSSGTIENPPVPTTFPFPALVQLDAGKTYALVVSALGAAADYSVWTARSGDTDVVSGTLVSVSPAAGSLYYAKDSQNWASISQESLMFSINRCQFSTNAVGYATAVKTPSEVLTFSQANFLSGPVDIQAGDDVWGLLPDRSLANTSVHGIVTAYDQTNNLLYVNNSTGNFSAGAQIQIVRADTQNPGVYAANSYLKCSATIGRVFDVPADGIVPTISDVTDAFSSLSFSYTGALKPVLTAVLDSTSQPIVLGQEYEFKNNVRYVMSYSNEQAQLGQKSSVNLNIAMSTTSDYTSPVVSLQGLSLLAYTNLINNDATNEWTDAGNATCRYIGKTVTLAPGMDAETINAWTSAYVPPGTSVLCYCRVLNSADTTAFDNMPWTQMTQATGVDTNSDPSNHSDYIEYQFVLPTSEPSPYHGEVWNPTDAQGVASPCTYVSSVGTFTGFQSFAIKVVLLAPVDATNYPRLDSVRAIAMMV